MNGIEKITARIDADTQAEIDRILGDANAQAEAIGAKYRAQAEAEDADLLAKGQRAAAEREERLISAAQMEARKSLLTVKQELVERAYQRALEKLCTLPREQYVELLAAMLVRASSTGKEEVIFSPRDREDAGQGGGSGAAPGGRRGGQLPEQGGGQCQRPGPGHGHADRVGGDPGVLRRLYSEERADRGQLHL